MLVGSVREKMLSQQIKQMVAHGLVRRIDYKVVPPHVDYELTAFGKDLYSALHPICDWGERNLGELTTHGRTVLTSENIVIVIDTDIGKRLQ